MTERSSTVRVVVAVTGANTLVLLPPFLLGAQSVFLRADLGFSQLGLGLAVAGYFAMVTVSSIPGGRLAERTGPRRALLLASSMGLVSMLLMASAPNFTTLVPALWLAGLGNGISQPAGNLGLHRSVPLHRQGLAFGIKQSGILFATTVSGLAISLLTVPFGWRVTFLSLGVGGFLLVLITYPREPRPIGLHGAPRRVKVDLRGRGLGLLAVASAFVTASAGSLGVFLVETGVAAGLEPPVAGLVLSLGSIAGVVARLSLGLLADRGIRDPLRLVATMLAAGVLGYVALSVPTVTTFIVGSVLAFAAGWGWSGLFVYAVVRAVPAAPAAATGVTQTGFAGGNVVGPVLFGWVAGSLSFGRAWAVAALLAVIGTVLMARGAVLVARAP